MRPISHTDFDCTWNNLNSNLPVQSGAPEMHWFLLNWFFNQMKFTFMNTSNWIQNVVDERILNGIIQTFLITLWCLFYFYFYFIFLLVFCFWLLMKTDSLLQLKASVTMDDVVYCGTKKERFQINRWLNIVIQCCCECSPRRSSIRCYLASRYPLLSLHTIHIRRSGKAKGKNLAVQPKQIQCPRQKTMLLCKLQCGLLAI